jgi:hypothetical protein
MEPIKRTWVTDDPDDTDNARYVPPEVSSESAPKKDPQSTLDDFADRLQDTFDDPPQRIIDIDRLMAERQGLTGTLDPYIDPKGVLTARQAQLKPYLTRYADYHDIASMWGLPMNGYRFPRDKPDEDIERFLEDMWADLQRRITHKKRFGW